MFGWFQRIGEAFTGRDRRWPAVRRRHVERFPECAACGSTQNVEVHHITPVGHAKRTGRPELELDPDNLLMLCGPPKDCHWWLGHACDDRKWRPEVRRLADEIRRAEVRSQGDV